MRLDGSLHCEALADLPAESALQRKNAITDDGLTWSNYLSRVSDSSSFNNAGRTGMIGNADKNHSQAIMLFHCALVLVTL